MFLIPNITSSILVIIATAAYLHSGHSSHIILTIKTPISFHLLTRAVIN